MKASEVMTPEVVSVRPTTPIREIARLLLEKHISAVPVVGDADLPLGMVSEGDLVGRRDADRDARRDWWLDILAEGEALNPEFVAMLHAAERTARDVMSAPVVTVDEDADIAEIARLLTTNRIKRVPVVREGRIVGIVSRADLLRGLAQERASPGGGFLARSLAELEDHFDRLRHRETATQPKPSPRSDQDRLTAEQFRELMTSFEQRRQQEREATRRMAAEERRGEVAALIESHESDEAWRALLRRARQAAEHGEREFLLLRFPSELCSDGGRAINVTEPDWPATLRGEAVELYLRWERDLKPHGFHLAARILDFPQGKPGDVGLFLVWGK